MKPKDIRKMINHYMKSNLSLAPGQKQITPLQAKLHYIKILSELRTFGGKCFMATLVVSEGDTRRDSCVRVLVFLLHENVGTFVFSAIHLAHLTYVCPAHSSSSLGGQTGHVPGAQNLT